MKVRMESRLAVHFSRAQSAFTVRMRLGRRRIIGREKIWIVLSSGAALYEGRALATNRTSSVLRELLRPRTGALRTQVTAQYREDPSSEAKL